MRSGSTARIPIPAARPVDTSDMPLISMPENGNSLVEERKPVMSEVRNGDDLNEVIEVLDAIKIPSHEFATAMKDPLARLVLEFEDVFQQGRPASPRFS